MNEFYLFIILSGSHLAAYFYAKAKIKKWKKQHESLLYDRVETGKIESAESTIYSSIFTTFIVVVLLLYVNPRLSPITDIILNNFSTESQGIIFNTESYDGMEDGSYSNYEYKFSLGKIDYHKKVQRFGEAQYSNGTATIQFLRLAPFVSRVKSSYKPSSSLAIVQIIFFMIAPFVFLRNIVVSIIASWKYIFSRE